MQTAERVESSAAQQTVCGLPVDASVLFSDKNGHYSKGIEKTRGKLLKNLGFLGRFLDSDEKILLVTTGCSPFTALEQLTIGAAWVVALKRAFFVFTDKRLLHIPATVNFKYRGSIAQVLYEDCRSLSVKGSTLVAEYHSGRKEKFHYIPGRDRAIIKRFGIEPNASDRPSAYPQRNHLCPHCVSVLATVVPACPSCGLEFKTKAQAQKYSLLIPGGGYFYTNHPWMGVMDALVESYLLVVTVVAFVMAVGGDATAWPGAIAFSLALSIEKLLTIYHSNSFLAEFIPQDLKSLLQGRPRVSAPPVPEPEPVEEPAREPQPQDVLSVR